MNQALYEVREASLAEWLPVNAAIPEFVTPYGEDQVRRRLEGVRQLALIAVLPAADGNKEQPIAFKVGYEKPGGVFYSWLGGVLPEHRRSGAAEALLRAQERWVAQQGYRELQVKSRNEYRNMLRFLIKHQYDIIDVEQQPDPIHNRIYFRKDVSRISVKP